LIAQKKSDAVLGGKGPISGPFYMGVAGKGVFFSGGLLVNHGPLAAA